MAADAGESIALGWGDNRRFSVFARNITTLDINMSIRLLRVAFAAPVSIAALALSGCAHTSVMPVASNVFEITASAAPVCGAAGAQAVASRDAAIATLQNGYDSYVILDGQAQESLSGYTPVIANSYGTATAYGSPGMATAYGSSTTTYSGGTPIIRHNQSLLVRMFHANDPGADSAVPARNVLGPNWQKIAAGGFPSTCL